MATNPYTEQAASGYNSSPPADDGSAVASNQVFWSTIKDKLADPIKVLADAIDDAVSTAFGKTINTDANEANAVAGSLAFTGSELTIATGAITVTRTFHTVDTESDAASDDLDTITATSVNDGAILTLQAENAARTVVVKDDTGNIKLAANVDFDLDDAEKRIALQWNNTDSVWYELFRSPGFIAATQAEQEAGTTALKSVTPAVQHHHPSAAKGWAEFTGAGVETGTYNVSSVADNSSGNWTVNWNTDFSSANYAIALATIQSAQVGEWPVCTSRAAGSVVIEMIDTASANAETTLTAVSVVAFGDHA